MNIQVEVHCHTNVVKHAYSTIIEAVQCAKEAGLRGIAVTDHGPELFDGAPLLYFRNMDLVSDEMYGVRILKGVEANILDQNGRIDLPPEVLQRLDWVIASIHIPEFEASDFDACTSAYLGAIDNPYVDMLGHTGRGKFFYDHQKVILRLIEKNKIMEFNEHSFDKPGAEERCVEIAKLCKRYGATVSVGSDAHFAAAVGKVPRALQMLEEIGYPQDLILNLDADRFFDYIEKKKQRLADMPVK